MSPRRPWREPLTGVAPGPRGDRLGVSPRTGGAGRRLGGREPLTGDAPRPRVDRLGGNQGHGRRGAASKRVSIAPSTKARPSTLADPRPAPSPSCCGSCMASKCKLDPGSHTCRDVKMSLVPPSPSYPYMRGKKGRKPPGRTYGASPRIRQGNSARSPVIRLVGDGGGTYDFETGLGQKSVGQPLVESRKISRRRSFSRIALAGPGEERHAPGRQKTSQPRG